MTVRTGEQRSDRRLRYRWPMRFAKSVTDTPSKGQMVDVSSTGVAFICSSPKDCPDLGKAVITCFNVPRFDSEISFGTTSFKRVGRVCRVDNIGDLRRVAVQFVTPLPLKPGRQPISEYDRTYTLATNSRGIAPQPVARHNSRGKALWYPAMP